MVAGGFVAVFWFRRWARSRVETADPTKSYLELTEAGFHLAHAGEVERIPWELVRAVEADEERVAVRVEVAEREDALYVEPTFGGLGLYELESAMRAAREASPSYAE